MRLIAVPLVLLLAGCLAGEPVKVASTFDAKAAEYIHKQGEGRIDGHAFFKKPNGYVMMAAGEPVWLIPATPYAKERMAALYKGRKFAPAGQIAGAEGTDPKYFDFTRRTKAESSGRFTFEKVAPGDYFLVTTITWKDNETDVFPRGGSVYEAVTVTGKEDKAIKVIVNGL